MKAIWFFISGLSFLVSRRRAFVEIQPQYRDFLKQLGLKNPEDFLNLPSVIVSGHPDRNVARVKIGSGKSSVGAYLKREHRLPWRDRLANAWAGFGWCSKSYREALMLRAMRHEGVSCPEFLAVGEDGRGRAFLLVREVPESVDLRTYLREGSFSVPTARGQFARKLGEALARLHDAGFDHPDLYSKHVLVNSRQSGVSLLDCQRTRRRQPLTWHTRWHDLAALDATLTDDLAGPRDRLRCLRSYLKAALTTNAPKPFLRKAGTRIRLEASHLLRHRHIREIRQPPLGLDVQGLIWVHGESVCVTREFHDALQGQIPIDLLRGRRRPLSNWTLGLGRSRATCCRHTFRGVGPTILIQRRASMPFRWLWAKLRGRRLLSPELEQAGIIFRLERYGLRCARVLAFGQSQNRPWRCESFILVQDRIHEIKASRWMAAHSEIRWTAERKQGWKLLRAAGSMLQRMHQAHCYLPDLPDDSLVIENTANDGPVFLIASAKDIHKRRYPSRNLAKKNLRSLIKTLGLSNLSQTDRMRLLLGYLGLKRLTPYAKKLASDVML
jgi:hypothetical protein